MLAPHIPHRIGKKVASRKKSRLRRKKHAYRFFLNHEFIKDVTSHACRFFSKSRIYRIYQIAASAKPAISEGGLVWLTPFAGDEVNPRMAD